MDQSNHYLHYLAGLLAYVLAGRVAMRHFTGGVRETALAALNVTGVFIFLFYGGKEQFVLRFGVYLALIVGLYLTVLLFADKRGRWPWLAFFAPIAALIVVRYVPGEWYVALGHALGKTWHGVPNMIGISYLAFRCSRLVLEIRNGVVKKPNFLEYVNFAFFLPTMPVGPINTYANFGAASSLRPRVWEKVAAGRMRVVLGKPFPTKFPLVAPRCACSLARSNTCSSPASATSSPTPVCCSTTIRTTGWICPWRCFFITFIST